MGFHPITMPGEPEQTFGLAAGVGTAIVAPVTVEGDVTGRGWTSGYSLEGPVCKRSEIGVPFGGRCVDQQGAPDEHLYGVFPSFTGEPVKGMPVEVVTGVQCAPFASTNLAKWHAEADRALQLCRWSELAHELWTGQRAQAAVDDDDLAAYAENRRLAHPEAVVLGDVGGVAPVEAVSLMTAAFGGCVCGAGRVIHVPMRLVPYLKSKSLVVQQGQRLIGPAGESVLTDDGYPGTGPDGSDPDDGQVWIYGTSTIVGGFDDNIIHPEQNWEDALRVSDNTVLVRAKQLAMATWRCCHFAALVDLTGEVP